MSSYPIAYPVARGVDYPGAPALLGGASRDFPYPTFTPTVINRYRSASDFTTDAQYSATDTSSTDNPYGAATIPQIQTNGSLGIVRPSALTTTAGIDMSALTGQVRINFKPISGVTSLSTWQMRLFSGTNVASAGSNYHFCDMPNFKSQCTGVNGTGAGRWQSVAAPLSAFSVNGTGANLSAIRFCQILFFGTSTFQFGDVEYYSNPRTKGAVIWRFDDGVQEAPQYAYPILSASNIPAVLMPGAVGSATGIGTAGGMSIAQYQTLLAAGWQSASQCFSTEDNTVVDGWTRAQRMAEYASARNFARPYGRYRDTYDGSYYSNVGYRDMTAWPELRDSFRTLTNFVNGSASGNPLAVSEVFPFADPKNIVCLNFNSWGNVSDIYASHLLAALEQTRACKGVLIIGSHNEIAQTNFQNAMSSVIDYVLNQHPTEMEFTTHRRLLAPYNGDTLLG